MTPTRPTPLSDSQRGQIERIKRIAAAEAAKKARMESVALGVEARGSLLDAEALERLEAVRAQQERHHLQNQI